MNLEERQGTLERLTEKGVVLSGTWFGYSKYLKGEPLGETHLGCPVTVLVHEFNEKLYIDRVKSIGGKIPGWKAPEAPARGFFGGAGRRMSPEELELKKAERVQIARSVAIDRAIQLVEKGLSIEKIAAQTHAIEEYLKTGVLPRVSQGTGVSTLPAAPNRPAEPEPPVSEVPHDPASLPPEPKKNVANRPGRPARLPSKAVNELFNQAKRAGLVEGWSDYEKLIRGVLKVEGKSPYTLTALEFSAVEAFLKPRIAQAKVA